MAPWALKQRLLWEHALVTAVASRAFAERLGFPQTEEAFVGGLLHDLGKSVLGVKFPERYGPLLRMVYEQDDACLEREREAFGFDHAMVGEALASQWNLAPGLQAAVRWHHEPIRAGLGHRKLTAVVALANQLALEVRAGLGDPSRLEAASPAGRGHPPAGARGCWPASRRTSAPPLSGTRP